MIVEFRCDARRPRNWMTRKTMMIDGKTADIQVAWAQTGAPKPASLDMLFELERMLLRKGKPCEADPLTSPVDQLPHTDHKPDIVIDFTNAPRSSHRSASLYLRPRYNGIFGEDGALAAILAGDLPVIEIVNESDGTVLDRGQPSSEVADGLSGALATVTARTMTLLEAVLAGRPRLSPPIAYGSPDRAQTATSYVLRGIADAVAKRIYHLCCFSPHWKVAWRYTDDEGVWKHAGLSGPRWQTISDPGYRCYADPFPITWKGRTFVFFEDLDHRAGKAVISAIEFDERGPKGDVIRVLEEPWHLSYPFLIEDGGELWMIPESFGNNDVALYKCIEFPAKWERHTTLLSGLSFSDATITQHDGLYYLFGASRDGGGGYSDTLSIYHSKSLFGPWQPHASNPVLVDRSCARPAGNFVRLNGQLWRPVQNCSEGYGAALGLAEVTELSPTTFKQIVRHTIRPEATRRGRKLHTLNRSGRLEVIDGTKIQPKFRTPGF
ncbi:glucosamine inositolphosphorylceramide transferase family protein [Bradyrhizobium sp. SYSU BS000235]|uniref:glucosamine inositolphosphorylceramide transferase family protein n=1 Tax=Bradyrhizobium sp. SYSU BS000235 TaxID=3411332 RepID=UPI003C73675A